MSRLVRRPIIQAVFLTIRPRQSATLGSKSVFLRVLSCATVPSSSIPIKRQEPATSAARIAASRRSRCSLLKIAPGLGENECSYNIVVRRRPSTLTTGTSTLGNATQLRSRSRSPPSAAVGRPAHQLALLVRMRLRRASFWGLTWPGLSSIK
jgi:hypothetical protein